MYKILVISDYRSANAARPEAEMFIEIAKRGHQITICTYPEATYYIDRFKKSGIRVIPWHPIKKWSFSAMNRIRKEIVRGQYDILHLYNSEAMLLGLPAAVGLSVKVLLYRGYAGNIHWYDPSAYLKYLHPRADGVICITAQIKDLIDKENWYRSSQAVYIPKGHDPDWYKEVLPADLTQFGIPSGAFVVACMANNRPFKDVPTLLKAAISFTTYKDVYLLLIGSGMDTPENRDILRGTPAEQRVKFAGFVGDPLPLLKASHIIANTSYTGEAITKSVLEGMSLGLAPVITDIAGNRHLVDHGRSGMLVPIRQPDAFAGAVLELAADKTRCLKMGLEAQKYMQTTLHFQRTVDLTLEYYRTILSKDTDPETVVGK